MNTSPFSDEVLWSCERKRLGDKRYRSKMGSQVKIRLHFFFAIFDKSDTKKNRNIPLSLSTSLRSTANKPAGCCMWMMVDGKTEDISKDTDKIQVCVPSLLVICVFF